MTELQKLQELIDNAKRIVFFGGAGVSTESGIKDFRSVDGLYHQQYDYPPEIILSHSFFEARPEEFYRFYREKMLCPDVQPNGAHRTLAALEAAGKLTAVITQNIDGLHQAAGSKEVLELHGSVQRNYCTCCRKHYSLEHILSTQGVPRCSCGGVIRPDVVLYEEPLDGFVMSQAIEHLRHADLLIVGGTSLVVYPAAGLLRYYRGRELVLMNRDATPYDGDATLIIRQPIGETLGQIRI
jgi:NAD-dependent deacetylase